MGSSIFGILVGIGVAAFTLGSMSVDTHVYFNIAGIVFVTGASVGAIFLTYDLRSVTSVFTSLIKIMGRRDRRPIQVIQDLTGIAWKLSSNPSAVGSEAQQHRNSMIGDGLRLIENGFDSEQITDVMDIATHERRDEGIAKADVVRTAAKYPPAFGMIGTVIGLIALLHGLGPDSDTSTIGAAMSVALTTTLYGLVLSNYILIPMADNLESRLKQDITNRRIISQAIVMMNNREDPILIQETLNAYLSPSERLELGGYSSNGWEAQAS